MGASGDAENRNTGSALDFLVGTTAHVGGILQGTRILLAPPSTNSARGGSLDSYNLTPIRVYPSRIGTVAQERVHPAKPVTNATIHPFGRGYTLGAQRVASWGTSQIASGRTGPLR
jgi:hypothetical protein